MPCDTKVLIKLDNNKWNQKAREKLGLPLTGGLSQSDADRVRVEAGKIKALEQIQAIDPLASVTGMTVGSDELTIQLELDNIDL